MEEVFKCLDGIIETLQDSKEYKMCISLQESMKDNQEIVSLVEEVKKTQKEYIRSGYHKDLKEKLDSLEKKLKDIPVYAIYLENLSIVNERICYIKDSLNEYFDNLLKEKKY